MSDIDLSDIARGRRITAVTVKDLEMLPRRKDRPRRPFMQRLMRRVVDGFTKRASSA